MPIMAQLSLQRRASLCYYKDMIEMGIDAALMPYVLDGSKIVEGRLKTGKFITLRPGDKISLREDVWENDRIISSKPKVATVTVQAVKTYDSFETMLNDTELADVLPNVDNVAAGLKIYDQFYSPAQQTESGVVAIHFKL